LHLLHPQHLRHGTYNGIHLQLFIELKLWNSNSVNFKETFTIYVFIFEYIKLNFEIFQFEIDIIYSIAELPGLGEA